MKAEKLNSGKYRVKVYLGKIDGKKRWISVTAPTPHEAIKRASIYIEVDWTQMTVEQACEKFLRLRGVHLSPATLRGYQGTFNKYIKKDLIGAVRLSSLTTAKIQSWLNEMKVARKTKINHLGFLTSVLSFVDCDKRFHVRVAEEEAKELHTPTAKEVNTVLDNLDPETHLAACFGCLGLRRGEICALTVDDIDRKALTVKVSKDTVKTSEGQWIIKPPKTQKSKRTIKIPPEILPLLPDEGRLIHCSPDCITNRFARKVKKTGVTPFRFHDLRSFSASAMLSSEVGVARSTAKAVHGQNARSTL